MVQSQRSDIEALSKRELEIAHMYAQGDQYHQIASRLYIAPSTVRTHLSSIYRKLGVSSKLELHKVLEGDRDPETIGSDPGLIISELALNLEEVIRRERVFGEVLAIISRSHGDVQEVIAAVLGYALELCNAEFGILFEYKGHNNFKAAYSRGIPRVFEDWLVAQGTFEVGEKTGLGRVAQQLEVINIADIRAEEVYKEGDDLRDATANLGGARSFTAIPMLARGGLIGAFTIYRQSVRPFDDKVLKTAAIFADQSLIAIENARLLAAAKQQPGDAPTAP